MDCSLGVISKKPSSYLKLPRFSPVLASGSFTVLHSTSRTMIQFELIYVALLFWNIVLLTFSLTIEFLRSFWICTYDFTLHCSCSISSCIYTTFTDIYIQWWTFGVFLFFFFLFHKQYCIIVHVFLWTGIAISPRELPGSGIADQTVCTLCVEYIFNFSRSW